MYLFTSLTVLLYLYFVPLLHRLTGQLTVLKQESTASNAKVIVLQRELDSEREAAQQLTADVTTLNSQVVTLKAERDNRCAEIEHLKQLLENARASGAELGEKLAQCQAELKQKQEAVREVMGEARERQERLTLVEENLRDCESELVKSQALAARLQAQVDEQTTAGGKQLQESQANLARVTTELETMTGAHNTLQSELATANSKYTQLEKSSRDNDEQLSRLRIEQQTTCARVEELRGECAALREQNVALSAEKEAQQKSGQEEVKSLEGKVTELAAANEQVEN